MPQRVDDEALRRLDEQAEALQARTRPPDAAAPHGAAVGQAYRIVVELLAGVLLGLGAGFGVDMAAGTTPWGMIVGVLAGFVLSVYMARRTANRLMAQAVAEQAEGEAADRAAAARRGRPLGPK